MAGAGKLVEMPDPEAMGSSRQEGEDVKDLDKSALEDLILHYEEPHAQAYHTLTLWTHVAHSS